MSKIIATVGPACHDAPMVARLIEDGVRVFRINFSHGKATDFDQFLAAIREASRTTGIPVAALGDISGPKIRIGKVVNEGIDLKLGDTVRFVLPRGPFENYIARRETDPTSPVTFTSTLPNVVTETQVGQRVLLDDGAVRLLVVERLEAGKSGGDAQNDFDALVCQVTAGGLITSGKGINLPDTTLSIPTLTEHDHRCAKWAIENRIDFLALSFVRRADDVVQLKSLLSSLLKETASTERTPPVIAKIERPEALDELEAIIDASDGVMVARGDLGVEIDLARVPVIQKHIIRVARDHGRPVIVATQMLQSMIESPTPTRAEVSDVANAIFDGVDAVMLSGETAVGKYPAATVLFMARAIQQAEAAPEIASTRGTKPERAKTSRYRTAALALGVHAVVENLGAKRIVIWSQLGGGARYLSQTRPGMAIIAASSDEAALRRMSLFFGVVPVHMPIPDDIPMFIRQMDTLLIERAWAQLGDRIVVVAGEPIGAPGVTNSVTIHRVGDVCQVRESS